MAANSEVTAEDMPQQIVEDGMVYAIIIPASVEVPGLQFFTQPGLFLQVGQWLYDRGHRSVPHIHVYRPRSSDVTQEAIHVVRGAVEIDIYTENGHLIRSLVLRQGDTAILVAGGHAYTILEDNTKVLEVKNGPFTSAEEDRRPLSAERR
ncbi:MAG TPA: hypothetical protein GX507_07600 [Clostridia bacterium]|nr:hypothetical protein [Clostridia bacterium]